MTEANETVSSLINEISDRQLVEKCAVICKYLGKCGFFGTRYKDDKIKIKIIAGWDAGTYKIWWQGTLILDHYEGAWELMGPLPETRLYRPDLAEGWYDHLQTIHEKAIKIRTDQNCKDRLKRFGVTQ